MNPSFDDAMMLNEQVVDSGRNFCTENRRKRTFCSCAFLMACVVVTVMASTFCNQHYTNVVGEQNPSLRSFSLDRHNDVGEVVTALSVAKVDGRHDPTTSRYTDDILEDIHPLDLSFALSATASHERLKLTHGSINDWDGSNLGFTWTDEVDTFKANDSIVDSESMSSLQNAPLCSREQIIEGKWVRDTLSKPPYVTPTVHLRCYEKEAYYDKKNGWKTWKWYPTAKKDGKCYFNSYFDRKEFCRVMRSGVISIIGDSLSWEHYSSLVQLNGVQTHQGFQHQSRELEVNIYQSVCHGQAKVLYRRDDKLQNLTSSLIQNFPIVLVLNRGAHYVPDEELLSDIQRNIEELNQHWIPKCLEHKIKCHLFWRTSVPGHPGCSVSSSKDSKIQINAYNEPVNNLDVMEALIGNLSNYNNKTMNYHWYDYQHQNSLMIKEFTEAFGTLNATSPYFHFGIIDGYYLNVRRPDEHRAHQGDCLHNCYPSKMDIYNALLLHYLRQHRSDKIIAYLDHVVAQKSLYVVNENSEFDPEATEQARHIREALKHQHSLQ